MNDSCCDDSGSNYFRTLQDILKLTYGGGNQLILCVCLNLDFKLKELYCDSPMTCRTSKTWEGQKCKIYKY